MEELLNHRISFWRNYWITKSHSAGITESHCRGITVSSMLILETLLNYQISFCRNYWISLKRNYWITESHQCRGMSESQQCSYWITHFLEFLLCGSAVLVVAGFPASAGSISVFNLSRHCDADSLSSGLWDKHLVITSLNTSFGFVVDRMWGSLTKSL